MAMVDVVSSPPTGGLMARAIWLGSKVGSHLALFCIYRVNPVNSRNGCDMMTVGPTINIVFDRYYYHHLRARSYCDRACLLVNPPSNYYY